MTVTLTIVRDGVIDRLTLPAGASVSISPDAIVVSESARSVPAKLPAGKTVRPHAGIRSHLWTWFRRCSVALVMLHQEAEWAKSQGYSGTADLLFACCALLTLAVVFVPTLRRRYTPLP